MMMSDHQSTYEETNSPAVMAAATGDAGFFERERNRLIQDISKGVESILGNANDLNRKLEESISVGKEFHPISELWSKFERVMVASGIPNLYPQSSTAGVASSCSSASVLSPGVAGGEGGIGEEEEGGENEQVITPKRKSLQDPSRQQQESNHSDGIRFETTQSTLPPGVAPGGGRIYA